PGRRSTSSSPPAPWRSSGGATTPCPTTCSTWPSTSSVTGSCCRSRPCPTTSRRTISSGRSSGGSPARSSRCVTMAPSTSTPERILQRLDWKVVRRLDGILQGDYRSLFYGYGVDFADLREYQPEDDVRYIDWNVTARMDVPYVRQYHEDREVTAQFLLDVSPSIDFGTARAPKRALLVDLVGVIARLLTEHGNRVGAVLYGHRVERVI